MISHSNGGQAVAVGGYGGLKQAELEPPQIIPNIFTKFMSNCEQQVSNRIDVGLICFSV